MCGLFLFFADLLWNQIQEYFDKLIMMEWIVRACFVPWLLLFWFFCYFGKIDNLIFSNDNTSGSKKH